MLMLIKANVIRAPGRLQAMKVLCAQALRLTHRCPASESAAAVAALQRVSMATQTGFSTSNRGATASGNSNVVGTHVSPSGVREKMTREQASAQEAESLDEVDAERMQSEVSPEDFRSATSMLMDEVEDGLMAMQAANNQQGGPYGDDFRVQRDPDSVTVDLGPSYGQKIVLARDVASKALTLATTSGTYQYLYNPVTREFRNPTNHDEIRGLLTRDLMALHKGVPKL